LRGVLDSYANTAPTLVPFETFEIVWSLYHIGLQQDLAALTPEILPLISTLKDTWTDEGVGLSKGFVVDADDTALGFFILTQFDIVPDPRIFEHYETEDHFRCFSFERNISLDIHVHIVDTLKAMPHFPRRDEMLLKALNTLGRYLTDDYIVDKWHVSPYYSTSHAIIGLTGLSDNIIQKQIKWLLQTQQPNGSWTFYPHFPHAALEETAYVLMALMTVYEKKGNIPLEVIDRGFRYMERNYRPAEELPSMWISKVLYNPYHIVEAVLQSTMLKYRSLRKEATLISVS
jgi:halimadienyl-diphosphate synthase